MEKLDQLISKFKEVKEELEKNPSNEDLEKFYLSPMTLFAGKKKGVPAKPKSDKTTGIDKIKEVAKEKIEPTDKTKKPAPKLTGLDRIKAESMKPITATTVKKDEDMDEAEAEDTAVKSEDKKLCTTCNLKPATMHGKCSGCRIAWAQDKLKARGTPVEKPAAHPPKKLVRNVRQEEVEAQNEASGIGMKKSMAGDMKGAGRTDLTHPNDMGRANAFHAAMSGAFRPAAAQAAIPAVPQKKLTGLDRIKAMSSQPIMKDEENTHIRNPPGPSTGPTNKLGVGDIRPKMNAMGATSGSGYQVFSSIPKVKPAGAGLHRVGPAAGQPNNSLGTQPPEEKTNVIKEPTVSMRSPPKFHKTINTSDAPQTNMAMSAKEKLTLNKGGQWNLDKTVRGEDWSSTNTDKTINPHLGGKTGKIHGGDPKKTASGGVMTHPSEGDIAVTSIGGKKKKLVSGASALRNQAARDETGYEIEKAECSKCHADPCECQTKGVLVDKMDGGLNDTGSC